MLSVASLLNPIELEEQDLPRPSTSTSMTLSLGTSVLPLIERQKTTGDTIILSKEKSRGEIRYPPFENLDEGTIQRIQQYNVYPLGKIKDFPRHIPYSSGKKKFLRKTGRDSFEVFQYLFRAPTDGKDYTIMWDYNIGLVRITPFFKCCKYAKTTPARMLGQNPGLKEVTHSITGGALLAQGYWMPFSCARDICATFCYHISPALIPLFGPSFPSLCIHPESPEFGRMIISSSIIAEAIAEAEALQFGYNISPTAEFTTPPISPCSCSFCSKRSITPGNDINLRTHRKRRAISHQTRNETALLDKDFLHPVTPPTYKWDQGKQTKCPNLPESTVAISPSFFVQINPHPILTAIPRSAGEPCLSLWCQAENNSENTFNPLNSATNTCQVASNIEYVVGNSKEEFGSKVAKSEAKSRLTSSIEEANAAYSLIKLGLKEKNSISNYGKDQSRPYAKRRRAASI